MAQQDRAVTIIQLKQSLEPITREVSDLRDELRDMKKVITGNGSGVGLDEQVRNNRRDIERHDDELKKIKDLGENVRTIERQIAFMSKATWFVITVGGGYVVVEVVKFLLNGI